jgi:two-component system CheB/CheR fusion protein
MPLRNINLDRIDRVLPPSQIGLELANIGRQFHEPTVRTLGDGMPQPGEEQQFARILALLRGVSGIDFRLYKPTTIRRRIARRMLLQRVQTLAEYAGLLQGNPNELRELQEDALINVTRFFRDPAVFKTLTDVILPRIFEDREQDEQLRIWVAGCSSGEEAYSIAICLLEYLSGHTFEPLIQIFGTDASDQNIQKARIGIYPESVSAEISPERLRRFFVKVDKGYQVSKRVRDLCIFARHNLCQDPPFSRMHLISCRNVLIYLGAELQKQTLPTFHFALRKNGYLLLGTSETIREFTDLFQMIDRKHKFFLKLGNSPSRAMLGIAKRLLLSDDRTHSQPATVPEHWRDIELQRAADQIVLARYGPPGFIIDEKFEVLQSRGHTSPFMELPHGPVTLQLTRMLHESIAPAVTQAVRRAVEKDIPVRLDGLRTSAGTQGQEFSVEVLPIHTVTARSRCFLVLFTPSRNAETDEIYSKESSSQRVQSPGQDEIVDRLRQDLASTRLYLQTLLEERDAKNQELVSANEEIQSANEEMQSRNEELETTKDELQSSNEELQTVNDELQQRNAVLTQTSNGLSNLLNSVSLPVLMLSSALHIRHFTPPTQRLMNLRSGDVGRPFSEIRLNLSTDDLEPIFREVLQTLAPREIEVQDREGRWYLLRVRLYLTTDNKIEGVVVVLVDIDDLRRSQQELRAARDFGRSVIDSVPLPLVVVDRELRIRAMNRGFRMLAGLTKEDLDRRFLTDLTATIWGLNEPLRSHLSRLRDSSGDAASFDFEYQTPGENPRVFNIHGRALKPDDEMFLLVTLEDLTAYKRVERLLKIERERLAGEVASTSRELGRAQEELRALAGSLFTSQEDERRRVARELHDDISQQLALLEIDTQHLDSQIAVAPEQACREVEKLRQGISALSESVRRISHALHPAVIDDLGIAPAIRSLADDFRKREGMIVTFAAYDVPKDIPNHIATGLYRITQEALRNVAKHAGKTHVKIILKSEAGGVQLQVNDSGEGFDVRARRTGLGLISMEERARLMQGTLTVDSVEGQGTHITVQIPLAQNE